MTKNIHQEDPNSREYRRKLVTADEAVQAMNSNSNFCFGLAVGQPPALLNAVGNRLRAGTLKGLKVYYMLSTEHAAKSIMTPDVLNAVELHPLFLSGYDREIFEHQIKSGPRTMSYLPSSFHQIPRILNEFVGIDSFVTTVSPMDRHGYFSLGTNNDYTSSVLRQCRWRAVEVNRNMPRVFGDSLVHVSEVDAIVENDAPLYELPRVEPRDEDEAIGKTIAEHIPDGATLQMGIGGIPNAVAQYLNERTDLGLHTEMLCDGVVDLIKRGVINGRKKTLHKYKHVFTLAMGTAMLYEFMNDNPSMESYPSSYCNDPRIIAKNDNMVSINSAIEIDLYGQVNAEVIAHREFSGTGGALDFMRGAFDSKGGKSIIALYSTAKDQEVSRIVPCLTTTVTDPRIETNYVVTEFGVINLKGKSTKDRALALIELAHPKFRDTLREEARREKII